MTQLGHAESNAEMPFHSVESAWFWFVRAWQAYHDGARFRAGHGGVQRPCEPIDIMCVLDRLHRDKRLVMDHIHVLRHYGLKGEPPIENRRKEARAYYIWREAMQRLEEVLVEKGIVASPYSEAAE